jgi:hypothetical protein
MEMKHRLPKQEWRPAGRHSHDLGAGQAMPILWFFSGNERIRWPVALK